MDTFLEQIVPIKLKGKKISLLVLIWILAVAFAAAFAFLSTIFTSLLMIIIIIIFGIFYAAFKLSQRLFVEYEYIITNDELDVDKITAKASRTRLITVDLKEVLDFGEYNKAFTETFDKTYNCGVEDCQRFYIKYKHKTQGKVLIILTPNEQMLDALNKQIPRLVNKVINKKYQ